MYFAFTKDFESIKVLSNKNISEIDNIKYIHVFKININLLELLTIEKLTFKEKLKILFS